MNIVNEKKINLKVLFLVQKEQRVILDNLYSSIIESFTHCDILRLSSDDQKNLKRYFNKINTEQYDRIIFFLRFKKEIQQVKFIKTIPNLVILEHDAYQNYINCKYKGKFSKHYQALPWARIISSGYSVTQKLTKEGFEAVFVPKGYDQSLLFNKNITRDIELAFVGSLEHKTYKLRKQWLLQLEREESLKIVRTNSGKEYNDTLNRIRFFISADIGFGEYMIKNFEAMACGCVLFSYNQGDIENETLGFEDMKNIVLYNTIEELKDKLHFLRNNPDYADIIAKNGQLLAESNYSFREIGFKIAQALVPELRKKVVTRKFFLKQYSYQA